MSSEEAAPIWRILLQGIADAGDAKAKRDAVEAALHKDWYTVPEAAAIIYQHPKTVYKRIRAGELKANRPAPRKTRIHKHDLVNYLMKQAP